MTTEVSGELFTEDQDDTVGLTNKQYREISNLRVELRAAQSGRDLFMKSYAELIDGLIAGTVTVPGLQGATGPSIDPDELESAQLKIKSLTRDIGTIQAKADDFESKNGALNGVVSRLTEDLRILRDSLNTLKTQFKEVLSEKDRKHGEEVDELKRLHDENVGHLNQEHQREISDLNTIHENTVNLLNENHEKAVQGVKDEAERNRAAAQNEHERILNGVKEAAENARLAQEKKYNDLVDAHAREIAKLNSDHEAQVNRERAEAKAREDGLKEDYRILEESIPGQIKDAEKRGRDAGLGLAQSVVESSNDLGLDKLSSPALSAIRTQS